MSGPSPDIALPSVGRPRWLEFGTGAAICVMIALVAMGLGRFTIVPAVLGALLIGMAARRWRAQDFGGAGIDFCARTLLRFGVALIGVRLSLEQVTNLGWSVVLIAVGAVAVSLIGGSAIGRLFGLSPARSVLSAGAVGICGASAALAISSVLPLSPERERETVFTIAAVTTLSTIVMIAYPFLGRLIGFDDTQAGIFFGAAIHDVTQVVAAGAMVSPEATTTATATKLVRVACLAPAAVLIGLWAARAKLREPKGASPPILPLFLVGFVAMAIVANSGWVGARALAVLSDAATFCLVAATAGLGLKTSVRQLAGAGWRPVAAITAQTLLIGAYALGAIWVLAAVG